MNTSAQEEFRRAIAEVRSWDWRGAKDLQRHDGKKDDDGWQVENVSDEGVSSGLDWAADSRRNLI